MGKMTKEQVQEMRRMYGEGVTQGALSRHFRLGVAQVGRIVRGECWIEGAGARAPTQAEMDATLGRLLALQERVNARREMEEADPLVKEIFGGGEKKVPPPSLLDGGGEELGEEEPKGLTALQQRAVDLGMDIERARLIKGDGL